MKKIVSIISAIFIFQSCVVHKYTRQPPAVSVHASALNYVNKIEGFVDGYLQARKDFGIVIISDEQHRRDTSLFSTSYSRYCDSIKPNFLIFNIH